MKKVLVVLMAVIALGSCKSKSSVKKFVVKGVITNNPAKMIYLEEIPMTTMQRTIVDSAALRKDGKYELSTGTSEARAYTIRLDQNPYPLVAIINDASTITVNGNFSNENKQFPDSFDVIGSTASSQLKEYMLRFNTKLQEIFSHLREGDSLNKLNAPDSQLMILEGKIAFAAAAAKNLTTASFKNSSNPALTMFILGYYQTTANQQGIGLQPLDKSEVKKVIDEAAAKYPAHPGLASIKSSLEGWLGKQAPEISLPDPTGKEIKLSSFRGKYVLVDFWASWCKPCRDENPNLVRAYDKYKDKNFTILGVSLDRPGGKEAWMNAIMKDNLTWPQVSDLKEWDSEVVSVYGFGETGIPYNILVDPQGKIIAERLRGAELEARLSEVLK